MLGLEIADHEAAAVEVNESAGAVALSRVVYADRELPSRSVDLAVCEIDGRRLAPRHQCLHRCHPRARRGDVIEIGAWDLPQRLEHRIEAHFVRLSSAVRSDACPMDRRPAAEAASW